MVTPEEINFMQMTYNMMMEGVAGILAITDHMKKGLDNPQLMDDEQWLSDYAQLMEAVSMQYGMSMEVTAASIEGGVDVINNAIETFKLAEG